MIEAGRGHAERDWFCLLGRQVLLFVKPLRSPLRFSVVAWAQQPAPTAPACAVCSSRFSVVAWAFGAKCTEAFGANSAGICCLLQPRATFGLPFQRHLGVNSLWTNLFQTRVHLIARATCATCPPQPTDVTDNLSSRQAASRASLHPASTLRCFAGPAPHSKRVSKRDGVHGRSTATFMRVCGWVDVGVGVHVHELTPTYTPRYTPPTCQRGSQVAF